MIEFNHEDEPLPGRLYHIVYDDHYVVEEDVVPVGRTCRLEVFGVMVHEDDNYIYVKSTGEYGPGGPRDVNYRIDGIIKTCIVRIGEYSYAGDAVIDEEGLPE